MSGVLIDGFGDDLSVDGVRIGDLTPHDHEKIEKEKGGQNYSPLENVVISKVKDSSTLIARKPDPDDINKYIESEILDGLCCYSAVNQGQLNQTIVDAVIRHLDKEKLPTVPRSIRHKYMSAFLLSATAITEMDRVIPKVAGVESWELSFKICRRWGYEAKGIPSGKAIIVGARGNFHGRSLAAVSFSDDPESKENFGPFVPGIELVPYNDVGALERLFEEKGDYIAAFMVEPIQGEAGVIVPDDDYFSRVSSLCKKYTFSTFPVVPASAHSVPDRLKLTTYCGPPLTVWDTYWQVSHLNHTIWALNLRTLTCSGASGTLTSFPGSNIESAVKSPNRSEGREYQITIA